MTLIHGAHSNATGRLAATPARLRLADLLHAAEWALVLAAVGLWAGSRTYTPLMNWGSALLVASWLLRWARTGTLLRPTPLDGALLLFLVSGLVGVWAAPQLAPALVRFFLFLSAVGLFYHLVHAEPRWQPWWLAGFSLAGAGLAAYFATQHDWAGAGAKFAAIGRAGRLLNSLVPDLGGYKPHPNVAGSVLGVLTLMAAVSLAYTFRAWRRPASGERSAAHALAAGLHAVCLLVLAAGVVMTESRSTWLALAAALALAAWWWAAGRLPLGRGAGRAGVFWAGVGAAALAGLAAFAWQPAWLTRVFGALPGPNSAISRLDLFGQVWRLAADTPFTGGGLDAFAGLYATYILDLPTLLLTHAHNAYLNLLVEQGSVGALAYAGALLGAAWLAARRLAAPGEPAGPLTVAGALGVVFVLVHSLGDAALVASRAAVVVLVPAALVVAGGLAPEGAPSGGSEARPAPRRLAWGAAAGTVLVLALAAMLARRPLQAAWLANQGAVSANRVLLASWPTNQWSDGREVPALAAADPYFQRALALDPNNRTAHHRLGLRAGLARDFDEAARELEAAYAADPQHRGLIKRLGLTYAWLGRYDDAQPLLAQIPEARDELIVYQWWWGQQARDDLAQHAARMARQLAGQAAP